VPDGTAYEVYQGTLDPGAAALALSGNPGTGPRCSTSLRASARLHAKTRHPVVAARLDRS
jgi:hypothetical protein